MPKKEDKTTMPGDDGGGEVNLVTQMTTGKFFLHFPHSGRLFDVHSEHGVTVLKEMVARGTFPQEWVDQVKAALNK